MSKLKNLTKPIVLIGMMGAGKTTIGVRLAKILEIPFVDTDIEVEKLARCSITDIYKYEGEKYFEKLEQQVIAETLSNGIAVISTGGGSFMVPENRKLIKEKAISIWLKAEFDILYERVSRKKTRPVLERGDKKELLTQLINERYPVYSEANLTIISGNKSHSAVVNSIINSLIEYTK